MKAVTAKTNAANMTKLGKKIETEYKEIDKAIKAQVKSLHPKKHQTEIFEYIRRRHHGKTLKVGIIIGIKDKDVIRIGWSKVNLKAGDKFDFAVGIDKAKDRAMSSDYRVPAPNCIRRHLRQFGARTVRYFKEAKTVQLPA